MLDKLKIKMDWPKSSLVNTYGLFSRTPKDPSRTMGDLLSDAQIQRIYLDGKTFVDLVPRRDTRQIKKDYHLERPSANFNLREFIDSNFYELTTIDKQHQIDPATNMREHIEKLWPILSRNNYRNKGALLALPYPYIVPGGRFSEQFYWDSYFIMLGLKASGRWKDIDNMVKNYAYMIRKFGFIPTANRNYFLTRSQPPFFSYMIELLAEYKGEQVFVQYLPYLLAEYNFWMKGRKSLEKSKKYQAYRRIVRMTDGEILNRYFDDSDTPRPESYLEDIETANSRKDRSPNSTYVHLRAAAESGWDFSSRWFREPQDLQSIHTTDLVAVDLNCLLYKLESTIAETYQLIKQPLLAKRFRLMADRRAETIKQFCWNEDNQYFYDYDFRVGKNSESVTLAGVFPLYAKIATNEQAAAVAEKLKKDFLKPGGLLTTLVDNGQQWDAPNGWAPLQWVAVQGLRNYGYNDLADKVRDRWVKSCENVFKKERKLVEKYNVTEPGALGGGGEYQLQDGFGWTNGVYAAFKDEQQKENN